MDIESLFQRGYQPEKTFVNDPSGATDIELHNLFEGSGLSIDDTVIIQSGELNAFTYNNTDFAIMKWLDKYVHGEEKLCRCVEIYAGPEVIYEIKDGKSTNVLIDDYIIPELSKPEHERRIKLFYNSERYFVHSYKIGNKLLVFGEHNFLTTHNQYTNYIFNLSESVDLEKFHDDDIHHDKIYGKETHEIRLVNSEEDLKWFRKEAFTKQEYMELKEHVSDPEYAKEYFGMDIDQI